MALARSVFCGVVSLDAHYVIFISSDLYIATLSIKPTQRIIQQGINRSTTHSVWYTQVPELPLIAQTVDYDMRTVLVFLLISSILLGNFILFYFLGIPKLLKQLLHNHRKKQKVNTKQEWIEMQSDVHKRAKERRRKEERLRRERNAARKRSGFYAELEHAYNNA